METMKKEKRRKKKHQQNLMNSVFIVFWFVSCLLFVLTSPTSMSLSLTHTPFLLLLFKMLDSTLIFHSSGPRVPNDTLRGRVSIWHRSRLELLARIALVCFMCITYSCYSLEAIASIS
uniref:Uncharacterized protein n=1 Tax=Trypanosoma vivax (strain Y486) TaxID=1055687 RepID=G0UBV2_TRYVY|nr:hypothetical protein TVY486_1107840 [Trypanosoma vivax Y486]